jgi:hypothetical protein
VRSIGFFWAFDAAASACFEIVAAATIGPYGILSSCWFYLAIFPLTKDQ